jgi:hypothetical protein
MDYSIIIPSNNLMLAQQAKNCVSNLPVYIFNGNNYLSYAKLINDCIMSAKTEIVIIMNHKIRASVMNVNKMLFLINKGYGLVCMRNFYFYGFKKDLIRKVGFFDERYVGGGCEDSDLIRRLIENKIGWYDSVETPLIIMPTSWDQSRAHEFHNNKWKNVGLERLLPDEKYDYDLGKYTGSKFLELKHTILSKTNKDYFDSINFKFE